MSSFTDWLAERAAAREDAGLTRRLFASDAECGSGPMIDLAGNDYLGLSRHPRVVDVAADAARRHGASQLSFLTLRMPSRKRRWRAGSRSRRSCSPTCW